MPKRSSKSAKPKGQKDASQLAHRMVGAVRGEAPRPEAKPEKNPAAVALGKLGGAKGGPARAAALTSAKKKAIAKKAAKARWGR